MCKEWLNNMNQKIAIITCRDGKRICVVNLSQKDVEHLIKEKYGDELFDLKCSGASFSFTLVDKSQ